MPFLALILQAIDDRFSHGCSEASVTNPEQPLIIVGSPFSTKKEKKMSQPIVEIGIASKLSRGLRFDPVARGTVNAG